MISADMNLPSAEATENGESNLPSCLRHLLERTFKSANASAVNTSSDEYTTGLAQSPKRFKTLHDGLLHQTLPGISNREIQDYPMIGLAIEKILGIIKIAYRSNDYDNGESQKEKSDEIDNALSELEYLHHFVWERLNIGHWKTVMPLWRKLYTCVSLLKICLLYLHLQHTTLLDIVRESDMALLMGEPICNNVLSEIAEEINSKIICSQSERNKDLQLDDDDEHDMISEEDLHTFTLKNKSAKEFLVEESFKPSLETFLTYMNKDIPVLLNGIVDHWPAVGKWNVQYIQQVAGFRTVPVEIGQKYTSEDWTQKLMTLNDFIDKYMKQKASFHEPKKIGYVAQHNLFHQLPVLRKDIRIPDYCLLGSDDDVEINAWFGPANTISPTHHDPKHNVFVQVFGHKILRLFPPSESEKLKPFDKKSLLFNTSQIDVEEDGIFTNQPELSDIKHCDVRVKPGQALFIPRHWWHYVKSLTPSFSVSFWFQ